MCHSVTHTFFASLNTVLKDICREKFCLTAKLGFLSYSFCTLKQTRVKIGDPKREKCHTGGRGGGYRKVPRKCHVLFEWPLIALVKR
jgi:hypothetical protein